MKLILSPEKTFKIISDTNEVMMDNISCEVLYFSRTYTFDPIKAEGEWKLQKENQGTAIFSCNNYSIETREGQNGVFIRSKFRNLSNEESTKLFYFRVVSGDWYSPVTNCIYNRLEDTPFMIPNQMGNPVQTVHMIPEQSVTGGDVIVCRDQNKKENIFGFVSAKEYFNEISLTYEGRLTVSQLLEDRTVEAGEEIVTDWFYIGRYDNANSGLLDYGRYLAECGDVKSLPEVPTGWCTWYYYLMNVDQDQVALNMKTLIDSREKLPIKYIQIDDGWFEHIGDWTENEKFSKKMKTIADEVKAQGYIPGIWLCPFAADKNSKIFKEHPEYLVKNGDGTPCSLGNAGWMYGLDPTNPQAREYICSVFSRLSKDWGFRYIKLDYVISGVLPGKRYTKNTSTLKALRIGFKAIRESVTEDTFILACTSPINSAIGLVDAMRISVDIGHDWPALKQVCNRVIKRFFYHRQAFINDADCLIIRKAENEDDLCMRLCLRTDNEIEVFMTIMAASGGILMLSDKMPLLSQKQIDLLSRMFPINTRAAIPLDILENDCPGILDFGLYGKSRILALINWADKPKLMSTEIGAGHVFEFWSSSYMGIYSDKFEMTVPPHSVKLFFITEDAPTAVVGTDCCICPEIKQEYSEGILRFTAIKPNSRYFVVSAKQPKSTTGCRLEAAAENCLTFVSDADNTECEIHF